ncbi:MAG: PQQ-binding-like beta-propeller repeat protein, partial [Chloroflexia bacterium]|nr:PQQ-binding-like beta-propeller repeat protein [Chloroflexia bacterium]
MITPIDLRNDASVSRRAARVGTGTSHRQTIGSHQQPPLRRDIAHWLVFALLLLGMLPTPTAAQGTPVVQSMDTDWPMYRGNPARTGAMPGPGIDGEPVERWRIEVPGEIDTAPAIVNGITYVSASNGVVYALDAASGETLWEYETGAPLSVFVAVASGVVYG